MSNASMFKFFVGTVLLLSSAMVVEAAPAASCPEQNACLIFTMEPVGGAAKCGAGKCDYKVCAKIDEKKAGCAKTDAWSHTCRKNPLSNTCVNPTGFTKDIATETQNPGNGYTECQIVSAGSIAQFLFKDGKECGGSASVQLGNGSSASCAPRDTATPSCTGNKPGVECIWKVTTPSTCPTAVVAPVPAAVAPVPAAVAPVTAAVAPVPAAVAPVPAAAAPVPAAAAPVPAAAAPVPAAAAPVPAAVAPVPAATAPVPAAVAPTTPGVAPTNPAPFTLEARSSPADVRAPVPAAVAPTPVGVAPTTPGAAPTTSVALPPISGGGGGDPHFRTYDGTMYSFHGECDLVMARSNTFDNGTGLDVHTRTEIVNGVWSLISNAAIRIGSDIFEVNNVGQTFINNAAITTFPMTMDGKFTVTKAVHNVEGGNGQRFRYFIDLSERSDQYPSNSANRIVITLFHKMISVKVDAYLQDTEGMLGMHAITGMVGRDHSTVFQNQNDMGAEWQVTDNEAMLFHEVRSPQYPQKCILPGSTETSRRNRQLRAAIKISIEHAQVACLMASNNEYQFCIEDVLRSGDISIANGYSF